MTHIVTINLPDIGEGVIEGEVIEWLKEVGDALAQDEPVVVVMTDKATVELPAPYPGKLARQYFQPGQKAFRDKPLYDIEVAQEVLLQQKESKEVNQPAKPALKNPSEKESALKSLAIPKVRKLAQEMGVNINEINGTGKEGRVTIEDVKSCCRDDQSKTASHFSDDKEIPLIGIRRLMAQKMTESKKAIPHFSFHESAEVSRLVQLKENIKKEGSNRGVRVTYMPLFIRALSLTIIQFPIINSSFDSASSAVILHKQQNIGIATATERGLIVPVLRGVQKLCLSDLFEHYEQLKRKTEENTLSSEDMKSATITISNFGVLNGKGLWATPVITYPEVAILALNKIQKQGVIKGDSIVVKPVLNLSWSFDHRIIDGDLAAKVSGYFSSLLENPAKLL